MRRHGRRRGISRMPMASPPSTSIQAMHPVGSRDWRSPTTTPLRRTPSPPRRSSDSRWSGAGRTPRTQASPRGSTSLPAPWRGPSDRPRAPGNQEHPDRRSSGTARRWSCAPNLRTLADASAYAARAIESSLFLRSWLRLAGEPRMSRYPPRVEFLALIALALALWALRRAHDHERLRQRVDALEAQMAALRRGGRAPAPAPPAPAEVPAVPAEATGTPEASEDVAPEFEPADAASEPPPPDEAPPSDAVGPPATPPPPPRGQVDWERWIGVRGAAVLGGVVLALAGLFFFRYSIEHGLIPPWLRVVVGTLAGLGCVLVAERGLRRDYGRTADALAGAGVVILYVSFWAAGPRYGLVGNLPTFVLLAVVTAAGAVLARRHGSQGIAVLGPVGGLLPPGFGSGR